MDWWYNKGDNKKNTQYAPSLTDLPSARHTTIRHLVTYRTASVAGGLQILYLRAAEDNLLDSRHEVYCIKIELAVWRSHARIRER